MGISELKTYRYNYPAMTVTSPGSVTNEVKIPKMWSVVWKYYQQQCSPGSSDGFDAD